MVLALRVYDNLYPENTRFIAINKLDPINTLTNSPPRPLRAPGRFFAT